MALLALLSLMPDADVIAFKFGIPYESPFGHRGATHSIAFALICGVATFGLAGVMPWRSHRALASLLVFAVVLSHALLDSLTDGGLGVALFWPFTDERYFAPWRPIPVAPIGRRFFTTERGLTVAATELAWSLPVLIYALWPRRWWPCRNDRGDGGDAPSSG